MSSGIISSSYLGGGRTKDLGYQYKLHEKAISVNFKNL